MREIRNEADWYVPLFICRYTLIVASEFFLKRFGGFLRSWSSFQVLGDVGDVMVECWSVAKKGSRLWSKVTSLCILVEMV